MATDLYQTRSQRIARLEWLADRERQRLQTLFRREANEAASTLGRLHGAQDRFAPPRRSEFAPPVSAVRGGTPPSFTAPESLPTPFQAHQPRPRNIFEVTPQNIQDFEQESFFGRLGKGLDVLRDVNKLTVGYNPEAKARSDVLFDEKRRREQAGLDTTAIGRQIEAAMQDPSFNVVSPFAIAAGLTGGLKEPGKVPKPISRVTPEEGGAVPPGRPPSGGTLPEPPEPPISKLTKAIRSAGKATPEQRTMFAQERVRRTGVASTILERGIAKGKGAEAFGQAKGALAGEFTRPQFAVPEFTGADMHQLVQDIGTSKIPFYKKLNAQSALEDLSRGRIPEPAQLKALKSAFPQGGDELVEALLSKRSLGEKAMAELVSFLGLPQKLKASYDMGSRMRQGLVLGWSHPRQWRSNWKPTANALFSEKAAQETMSSLEANPWFSVKSGERVGLGFDDLGGHTYDWESFTPGPERVEGFQGMNESFINRVTDRIPGIQGSQRSFAVDLNKAGIEVYAQEAEAMWSAGVRDPEMYKAAIKVINHARGYGAFNPGQIGKGVSAFFSGRNLVARFQVALDPFMQPGALWKPSARQLAAKNLVGMIAGDMALLGLIGTAGAATGIASVHFNPLKPGADWLKVRIGDTRIDPWGGFIPMARMIARMGAAATTEAGLTKTEYDTESVKRELLTFFSNKEAPLVRKFTDAAGLSEAYDPAKLISAKTLVDIYSPFVSQDIWDAVKQQGWEMGLLAGAVSPVGIGVQTYTNPTEQLKRLFEEKYKRPFNPETDYRVAEQDDDFDFLLDRIRRQGLERGQEGAKRQEEAEQTRAQTEQELGLPELARQFQQGAENGPAIISRWEDLNTQMAGAYSAIYIGSDPKKKETPDGQALQALAELNPNLEPWTDFTTGEVDWDGFYTERERLTDKLSPTVRKAYEAFQAKSVDPDLQAIEPLIRQAKETRSSFYDLPRWLSIVKNQDRIEEIQKLADEKNLEIARQGMPDAESRMVYELVGLEIGDVQTALAAWQLRPGSRMGTELRSPERDKFLVENASALERFFPDLYRRELLQVQLGMR